MSVIGEHPNNQFNNYELMNGRAITNSAKDLLGSILRIRL
jgi:hypothetical protein